MDIKKEFDKTVDDVKDTMDEAKHRSKAEAEQTKRDVAGQDMTATEKAKSAAKEGANRVEADWDKTKRDVRDKI
ncbi:MAG: hypothetical protein DLM53_11640 [Candidatus Eremiobacter antarcticus]|nr:hypothetical protein [Candidatus Eremiobacteraeota bacterium]MBC5809010.1 hypothetical protein [Candidatus Eremiobacteraeota bacterium]PZR60316.1 MAG: hypothetical protein DLM53_11640 [Candidatus Eremiobacter sp. RRmetagenome_bin22]